MLDLLERARAALVHGDENHIRVRSRLLASEQAALLRRRRAVTRVIARTALKHQARAHQVAQHPAYDRLVVAAETAQDFSAERGAMLLEIGEHRIPQRATALAVARRKPRYAIVVGAQRHSE